MNNMNFVHRILKASSSVSSSSSSPTTTTVQKLVQSELQHSKLIYFGEFHGESRIISFQTQLVKELTKCFYASNTSRSGSNNKTDNDDNDGPTLHLIMEHFSQDMQPILDRYQTTTTTTAAAQRQPAEEKQQNEEENKAFEELVSSYNEQYGTEGHNLHPYRELLQFCRQSTTAAGETTTDNRHRGCKVKLHGGFIPRNQAARLNKEEYTSKQEFFQEMSRKGYLPKEMESMHHALFEKQSGRGREEDESLFVLRGSREHQLLIQSLMSGVDIYSPIEHEGDIDDENETESRMSRLYQAQLLKDHAMGYKIASLMMEHAIAGKSDRYMVIAGFGHLKHYTGVPDCVHGYLRQEALLNPNVQHRNVALDLLLSLTCPPIRSSVPRSSISGGIGSTLIGCQMMYEIYLEETYPPMIEAAEKNEDDDIEDDVKRRLLNDLYLRNPDLLDQYILNSEAVRGPLLHYSDGLAGFQRPCADFLFVYDEDDENELDEADLQDAALAESAARKCPFQHDQSNTNDDAKAETIDAYERVGQTAGFRGNSARARAIMTYLGYTESDLEYVADDIFNFQGVANPHTVANIQSGERVLDIGSGLGIDSFLAARNCGADVCKDENDSKAPFVVGVDIAQSEVNHATARAIDRGLLVPDRIRFLRGDVEKLNDALAEANLSTDNLFDVCISNGAFCLVPNKHKAFENVFKALRPGGRMAISTTTVTDPKHLDPSFEWPVCVQMFGNLDEMQSMCESIGFKNVQIIDAESPLEGMELPDEEEVTDGANGSEKRFKIHGKYSEQYEFLQNVDMDELCKVVTVYGEKP